MEIANKEYMSSIGAYVEQVKLLGTEQGIEARRKDIMDTVMDILGSRLNVCDSLTGMKDITDSDTIQISIPGTDTGIADIMSELTEAIPDIDIGEDVVRNSFPMLFDMDYELDEMEMC